MSLNPIGLVAAAIAGLVAGFLYLWNTSEEFRQFWINLWENVKEIVSGAIEGIKSAFSAVGDFFTQTLPEVAAKGAEGMKTAFQGISSFFTETLPSVFQGVLSFFQKTGSHCCFCWSIPLQADSSCYMNIAKAFGNLSIPLWKQSKQCSVTDSMLWFLFSQKQFPHL